MSSKIYEVLDRSSVSDVVNASYMAHYMLSDIRLSTLNDLTVALV